MRRALALRGAPEQTEAAARRLTRDLPAADCLWIGPGERARVRRLLGQAFDAVVLDLHAGLDADLLAQAQGFVWGGGALLLRLPEAPVPSARLRCHPYTLDEVGTRLFRRLLARLEGATEETLGVARHAVSGTAEQAEVVRRIASAPGITALLADRGRGKSAALGLALAELSERRVLVAAPSPEAAREVLRFGGERPVLDPRELAHGPLQPADFIAIDEAAQLSVPLLRRIVQRYPAARIAFATTVRGYEGTGRGFVLRFLEWLRTQPRPFELLRLTEPIRWRAGDPLEALVHEALLLDAQAADTLPALDGLEACELDRDALDEVTLRDFFGLLVHAHYRTTPEDLHRLLDAPNLRIHALRAEGRVVAVSLVALEGGLDAELVEDLYWGRGRLRGHALPDSLVSHLGHREAGRLRMIRSVRIAVHPALRRLGLGSRLIEHVHACYQPDLFGTLFGATPELLRFRRQAGYRLVRLGVARGSRTGEPAVLMMRPRSEAARALCATLRAELARDLPLQLELLQAGEEPLSPALLEGLTHDLPPPAPLTDADYAAHLQAYTSGPRSFESVATAISRFVGQADLSTLSPVERTLVQGRVLQRAGWTEVARRAGLSHPAAMRGLRRAIRRLNQRPAPWR